MKKYLGHFVSIWFLLLFFFPELFAQSASTACRHFNVQNGLLSNNIEHVYVDQEGYVWFATSNGLQQFDGYNFTNYNYNADDNSSISYNFISAISEDTAGNIWIGTLGRGVDILTKENRKFRHLFNEPTHNLILTSNIVPRKQEVFALDEEGNMWLNTDNGLNKINTADYSVEHYFGDFSGELLYDSKDKVFWIASNVLKRFNPKTRLIDYYQIYTNDNRNNSTVNSFRIDNEGLMWLGTNSGLVVFDRTNNVFYSPEKYFKKMSIGGGTDFSWSLRPIEFIFVDNQGHIWIAIDKSIVKLDKYYGTYQVFMHEIDNLGSLLDGKVAGIYGNGSGALWIIYTSLGVSRMNIFTEAFTHHRFVPGNPNSLSGNTVRSVYQDRRQNIWIGNYSDGLNRVLTEIPEQIVHYMCDPGDSSTINSNYITSIYVDTKERLWVGTFDKGFCFADNIYQSKSLVFKRYHYEQNLEVQDFCEDAAGNIWVGTQWGLYIYDYTNNKLVHYGDQKNQLPELQQANIQSVFYESPNTFWITTWNRGICKLIIQSDAGLSSRVSKDSLIVYEDIKDINNFTIDNCFISLCKEGNIIWLGSNVNGLVKMILRPDGADFIKYDQSRGAPGSSVYGIAKDDEGKIWVSTNHGLGKFDPITEKFINYYESDGLHSNSFVWNSYFQNQEGKIFFGGVNGLTSFFPYQLSEERDKNNVHISKLIVKNKELQIGDEINGRQILTKNIQYTNTISLIKEPAFTIEFVALNPLNPEEIIYSYKLEGFDKDWIHTTSKNRFVTYSNLRQGTYNFLVKASNNISDQNQKSTSLTVKILPPWWQTPFALTAFSGFFIGLLILLRWLILMRIRLVHEAKYEHMERQKTDELFQFKMRFFTDISHEFGNLLSLILSPLQYIASKVGNDPQLAEQSRLIRKNSARLLKLTEQVIDMRKIDLNKMKLTLSKADIIEYIKDLTFSFGEIALQRSMKLEFTSEIDSYFTWFDENKIDRIISNLLSNAFKFTPDDGEIKVSMGIRKKLDTSWDQTNGGLSYDEYIEIRINDNGIGIPAKDKNHIFERFLKIERNDSIVRQGTGIGLALTKELVELQNGNIRFESEENKGTCFIIQLPVVKDPGKPGEMLEILDDKEPTVKTRHQINQMGENEYIFKFSLKENEGVKDRNKPIVLLVEDELEIRAFLKENLKARYQVYEADNGVKCFDIAVRIDPDIIISDIIMPQMDGVELCRKIKADPRTSHIPVILLTARSGIESKIEGMESGADAYVEKPFIMELLDTQIKSILKNRKVLKNKFSKELIVKPADITITPLNVIVLKKAMAIVEKHISDGEFGTSEFAREMGMSRSRLHRKLKALTTQSSSEFIQSIRLKRAADLINDSQLSMEEISLNVGFNSPAYFTKCYKKYFGKTPTEYKAGKPA